GLVHVAHARLEAAAATDDHVPVVRRREGRGVRVAAGDVAQVLHHAVAPAPHDVVTRAGVAVAVDRQAVRRDAARRRAGGGARKRPQVLDAAALGPAPRRDARRRKLIPTHDDRAVAVDRRRLREAVARVVEAAEADHRAVLPAEGLGAVLAAAVGRRGAPADDGEPVARDRGGGTGGVGGRAREEAEAGRAARDPEERLVRGAVAVTGDDRAVERKAARHVEDVVLAEVGGAERLKRLRRGGRSRQQNRRNAEG